MKIISGTVVTEIIFDAPFYPLPKARGSQRNLLGKAQKILKPLDRARKEE